MDLYISDLDGTLLNSKEKISEKSVEIINSLLLKGLYFTIATARSFEACCDIIAPLRLKLPVIVHNGVFIYDPVAKKNIVSNFLENNTSKEMIQFFEDAGVCPMVYAANSEGNKVYYRGIFNKGEEHYIQGRLDNGDKRFTLVKDYASCKEQDIISFVAIGEHYSTFEGLYREILERFQVTCHLTQDIYSKAYWLEVTHKKANKKDAVKHLKDILKANKLICFGDNLNDYPMFEIADECCAVKNAHELLKKAATKIIPENNQDGVARYLLSVLKDCG